MSKSFSDLKDLCQTQPCDVELPSKFIIQNELHVPPHKFAYFHTAIVHEYLFLRNERNKSKQFNLNKRHRILLILLFDTSLKNEIWMKYTKEMEWIWCSWGMRHWKKKMEEAHHQLNSKSWWHKVLKNMLVLQSNVHICCQPK